uniref:Uncharacterized protein n=1 Tax=Mesocestoides corti TaxID=53468 RepID=A0A5K3EVV8_MESCO
MFSSNFDPGLNQELEDVPGILQEIEWFRHLCNLNAISKESEFADEVSLEDKNTVDDDAVDDDDDEEARLLFDDEQPHEEREEEEEEACNGHFPLRRWSRGSRVSDCPSLSMTVFSNVTRRCVCLAELHGGESEDFFLLHILSRSGGVGEIGNTELKDMDSMQS